MRNFIEIRNEEGMFLTEKEEIVSISVHWVNLASVDFIQFVRYVRH